MVGQVWSLHARDIGSHKAVSTNWASFLLCVLRMPLLFGVCIAALIFKEKSRNMRKSIPHDPGPNPEPSLGHGGHIGFSSIR